MLLKKVRGQTEAAARRRRALALASLPDQGNKKNNKNIEIATSRMWGPEQQKESERQERLQKERKLDAADMGVVEGTPLSSPGTGRNRRKPTTGTSRNARR